MNDAVSDAVSAVLPELSVTASTVQDQTSTGEFSSVTFSSPLVLRKEKKPYRAHLQEAILRLRESNYNGSVMPTVLVAVGKGTLR